MNVINCFEHQNLAITDLPEKWRSKSVLKELENFLQNNWDQRGIFYSDDKQDSRQCFIDFDKRDGIRTQNYIGTIAYGGGQINIFPKVYRQDKTDISQLKTSDLVQDFVNWLSYCDKLNFPFISHKDELANTNSLLELLITVYLHFVQESLKKQLYHRYEETVETGAYIKGKINLKDYAQLKYPSGQHHLFTYTYSNFQFDNALNRIIKSTCSLLFQMTEQDSNIRILRNILMRLSDVSTVDSTPYDCDQVYLSMAHKDYQIILDMSRMFLYNKISTYTSGDSRTFCFLFPAELLFEEYIAGLMKEIFGSDQVSTQMRDTNLAELYVDGSLEGRAFSLREDILFTTAKGDIVLDTKYKRSLPFDRIDADKKLGVSDADAKQMLAYAIKRGAKKLYLIYPLYRGEKVESQRVVYRIDMEILGLNPIYLEILRVPFACAGQAEKSKAILETIEHGVPELHYSKEAFGSLAPGA